MLVVEFIERFSIQSNVHADCHMVHVTRDYIIYNGGWPTNHKKKTEHRSKGHPHHATHDTAPHHT